MVHRHKFHRNICAHKENITIFTKKKITNHENGFGYISKGYIRARSLINI